MLRTGTSVSSISFSSVVCSAAPADIEAYQIPADAILSILINVNECRTAQVPSTSPCASSFAHEILQRRLRRNRSR